MPDVGTRTPGTEFRFSSLVPLSFLLFLLVPLVNRLCQVRIRNLDTDVLRRRREEEKEGDLIRRYSFFFFFTVKDSYPVLDE